MDESVSYSWEVLQFKTEAYKGFIFFVVLPLSLSSMQQVQERQSCLSSRWNTGEKMGLFPWDGHEFHWKEGRNKTHYIGNSLLLWSHEKINILNYEKEVYFQKEG